MTPLTKGLPIILLPSVFFNELEKMFFERVSRHKYIYSLRGLAINTASPGCLAHKSPPGSVLNEEWINCLYIYCRLSSID